MPVGSRSLTENAIKQILAVYISVLGFPAVYKKARFKLMRDLSI